MSSLGQILSLKTRVEHHYCKFSRTVQKELAFIEKQVRDDAQKMSKIYLCCLKLCSGIKSDFSIEEQTKKLNLMFFKAFQIMSPAQRQDYFLMVLKMIDALVQAYEQKKNDEKKKMGSHYLKQLRQILKDQLEQIHEEKEIREKMQSLSQQTFYLKAILEGVATEKVLRFNGSLMVLLQHVNRKETAVIIDARNYLLLGVNTQEKLSLELQAAFPGLYPQHAKLIFQSEQDKYQIVPYLKELNKIGVIQRLVDNFDLQLLVFDRRVPKSVGKASIFSNYLSSSTENFNQLMVTDGPLKQTISPRYSNKRSLLRRQSDVNYYNQIKGILVKALNELAEKKLAEVQRVNKFKNQDLAVLAKTKSQQLLQAASCEEAQVHSSKIASNNPDKENFEGQELLSMAIVRIAQKTDALQKIQAQGQRKDSLRSEEESSRNLQRKPTIKAIIEYSPNIYKQFYPDKQLTLVSYLKDFNLIVIDQKIWQEPPMKEGQLRIKKQLETNQLKQKVAVYQHIKQTSKFKVVISLAVDFKFLVLALSNLQAWKKWHPDIDKVEILRTVREENVVDIYLECTRAPIAFSCCLRVHLFKVDSRYFMVMKSLPLPEQKKEKRSLFSLLGLVISNNRNYEYLILTIQTFGSKGINSQIIIDFQVDHSQFRRASRVKKQQLTFFINFYYISSFWAIGWETATSTNKQNELHFLNEHSLFNPNWTISSMDFNQKSHL